MQETYPEIQTLQGQQNFLSQVLTSSEGLRQLKLYEKEALAEIVLSSSEEELFLRAGVYSDAYFLRLKEILESDYEAALRYLGADRFLQLIVGYLKSFHPRSPNASLVGDRLFCFVKENSPWKEDALLSSIVAFEWANVEAIFSSYHEPSVLSLNSFDANELYQVSLKTNPSVFWIQESRNVEHFVYSGESIEKFCFEENHSKPWVLVRRTSESELGSERCSAFEKTSLDFFSTGQNLGTYCEKYEDHSEIQGFLRGLGFWIEKGLLLL